MATALVIPPNELHIPGPLLLDAERVAAVYIRRSRHGAGEPQRAKTRGVHPLAPPGVAQHAVAPRALVTGPQ